MTLEFNNKCLHALSETQSDTLSEILSMNANQFDEIRKLLEISSELSKIDWDPEFKLRMTAHLNFNVQLNLIVHEVLTEEAYTRYEQEQQRRKDEARQRDLHQLEEEEKALLKILIALAQKNRNAYLLAMLLERLYFSDHVLKQLHTEKSKLKASLVALEVDYRKKLKEVNRQYRFYDNMSVKDQNKMDNEIDRKLNKIDNHYAELLKRLEENPDTEFEHHELYGHVDDIKSAQGKHRVSAENLHDLRVHSKKAAVKKIGKQYAKEHGDEPVPDRVHDDVAQKAVELHEKYVKERQALEAQIAEVDKKIAVELKKKEQCQKRVNEIAKNTHDIKKFEKLKSHVEKTSEMTFSRLSSLRDKLVEEKRENLKMDDWIVERYPQVFEPIIAEKVKILQSMINVKQISEPNHDRRHIPSGAVALREFHMSKEVKAETPATTKAHHSDWADKRRAKKAEALKEDLEQIRRVRSKSNAGDTEKPPVETRVRAQTLAKDVHTAAAEPNKRRFAGKAERYVPKKKG